MPRSSTFPQQSYFLVERSSFRRRMKGLSVFVLSLCFAAIACAGPFKADQKEQLVRDCEKEIEIALKVAHNYQGIEIGFKVLIFLLTLGVATTSIIIAAR